LSNIPLLLRLPHQKSEKLCSGLCFPQPWCTPHTQELLNFHYSNNDSRKHIQMSCK
jgi:hypothetical protein